MTNGVLVLEDKTVIKGNGLVDGFARGEVVFTTSMVGYPEYLSDPSYKYQILVPTYPLIGNYGVNEDNFESDSVKVEGLIVKELCDAPSHHSSKKTLLDLMKDSNVPVISGVDTRFLTRKIRNHGVMLGILKVPFNERELPKLIEEAENLKPISGVDLVDIVTTNRVVVHEPKTKNGRTVLIDCGTKQSIIRSLLVLGQEVVQVPANTTSKEILNLEPDNIVISNGPGDPKRVTYTVKTVKKLVVEQIPILGICLGNQILALSLGASTYKLKFGHRGANQPVKDLATNKVYITSQNHSFAVDKDSLDRTPLKVSHINLNDGSVEGMRSKELPIMSVQYHPEAHPGPLDNFYIFKEFLKQDGANK